MSKISNMKGVRVGVMCPRLMPMIDVAYPGAVQNAWNMVLPTSRNVRLYTVNFQCTVAAENVELEMIIDGVTLVGTQAPVVAGTWYGTMLSLGTGIITVDLADHAIYRSMMLEGRSIQIRIRKTTAVGASALNARVQYGLW